MWTIQLTSLRHSAVTSLTYFPEEKLKTKFCKNNSQQFSYITIQWNTLWMLFRRNRKGRDHISTRLWRRSSKSSTCGTRVFIWYQWSWHYVEFLWVVKLASDTDLSVLHIFQLRQTEHIFRDILYIYEVLCYEAPKTLPWLPYRTATLMM